MTRNQTAALWTWALVALGCGPMPANEPCVDDCGGGVELKQHALTTTIAPAADAYVRDGTNAGANFGTATTLQVKTQNTSGNTRWAYLRFSLTGVSGTVSSAKLRLHGSRPSTNSTPDSAFAVSSNSWSETGITWNNKPALGAKQGSGVVVGTTVQYYEWDVAAFVASQKAAGQTAVSLAVKMDADVTISPDSFSSREAASNRPQLVVVTGSANQAPTVATPAAASPNPVTGTTTALSVRGADDGGESGLTYTWSTTGSPPAPVSFAPNGSNAAKNATATFSQPGSYGLAVQIRDAGGLSVTSSVTVTVNPTFTGVTIWPTPATVPVRAAQQFTANAVDQFGNMLAVQPTFTWSVSGGGTVASTGIFTAGAGTGGPFTVTASSGGKSGTAQVTVVASGTAVTLAPAADAYVRDGTNAGANFGTATTLAVKQQSSGNNRIAYLRFPLTGVGSNIAGATLRLHGSRPSANAVTDTAWGVTNTSWSETGITWNNKPAFSVAQGLAVVGPTAQYYEWNVTDFVRERKNAGATAVTLAVQMDSQVTIGPDTFSSREATSNRPQLVVANGTACEEWNGCACALGEGGAACETCAEGFRRDTASNRCVLINDGSHTEWPNATSKLNSDPWLAVHHDEIRVMKPKVLVLVYGNERTFAESTTLVDRVIAGFAEGSKPQGFKNPGATPQLSYQIAKTLNFTDGSGNPNGALLPKRPPGEPGNWTFDYDMLFDPAYAANYGYPDSANPGRFLDLCQLVNNGTVHEVWVVLSEDPAVTIGETVGMSPNYTITGNKIPGSLNRCSGNGCLDQDVRYCGRTVRIGGVNHQRGPGCFIHGQGHSVEWFKDSIPTLRHWFMPFAGFNYDVRWGLPFQNFYWVPCPEGQTCIEYPSTTHMRVDYNSNIYDVDPFDPVCGNVHFPPNAIGGYDYDSGRQVRSTCTGFGRHQGGGGNDASELLNRDRWMPVFPQWDDCGGEFMVWWFQNMPGFGSGQTFSDGRTMKSMWPFMHY
jgi:hypothetical protein